MKKFLSILLALALLASLAVPAFADGPDYTTGTPWICSDLDGVVTEETTADLKDNFVLAVNKESCSITLVSPDTNLQSTINCCGKLVIKTASGFPSGSRVKSSYFYTVFSCRVTISINFLGNH